uniref:HTH_48 domain-containing protein n=1 Tax=Panagrellus redivivus TaxID=6233 RepID=A0A7E4VLF5_PANRE
MSNFTKSTLLPIVYYEYHRKSTPEVAVQNIRAAFKGDVIHVKRVEEWYSKFESGEITFEQQCDYGRRKDIDDEKIRQMLLANPKISARQMSKHLGCDHTIIAHRVRVLGLKLRKTWKRRNPPKPKDS